MNWFIRILLLFNAMFINWFNWLTLITDDPILSSTQHYLEDFEKNPSITLDPYVTEPQNYETLAPIINTNIKHPIFIIKYLVVAPNLIPVYFSNLFGYPITNVLPFLQFRFSYQLLFGRIAYLFRMPTTKILHRIPVVDNVGRYFKDILEEPKVTDIMKHSSTIPTECFYHQNPIYPIEEIQLLHMLADKNLTVICGESTRSVLRSIDMILQNHRKYINAIEYGKFDIQNQEPYFIKPDKNRADILNSYFSNLKININTDGWMMKIWPRLNMIVCKTYGLFKMYLPRLKYYSNNLTIWTPIAEIPEIIFGANLDAYNNDIFMFDRRQCTIHPRYQIKDDLFQLVITTRHIFKMYDTGYMIQLLPRNRFRMVGRKSFYDATGITEEEFSIMITNMFGISIRDVMLAMTSDNTCDMYYELYDTNATLTLNITGFKLKMNILKFARVKPGTFHNLDNIPRITDIDELQYDVLHKNVVEETIVL